jgi:lipoate-protein ligase A
VKTAIDRAAKLSGLSYWRAFDVWYGKARQIADFEIEQIAKAIEVKNERDARNELRDLKARIARMESLLAQGDAHFHSPSIAHAREMVRQLRELARPLVGRRGCA